MNSTYLSETWTKDCPWGSLDARGEKKAPQYNALRVNHSKFKLSCGCRKYSGPQLIIRGGWV